MSSVLSMLGQSQFILPLYLPFDEKCDNGYTRDYVNHIFIKQSIQNPKVEQTRTDVKFETAHIYRGEGRACLF